MIKVNDLFHTIQGEGFHAGRRALFIRMPKCNLSCSWCDTEFETSYPISRDEFDRFALQESHRFAVITGGEPLLNKDLPTLIGWLKSAGFYTAVETNGTMPYRAGIDWVTCSPKRDAAFKIHRLLKPEVSEYKYVIDSGFDFSILDRHREESENVRLSVSPEYGNFEKSVQKMIEYIKENPRWRISLQTHKIMGIA